MTGTMPLDVTDFVRSLTPEQKDAALVELIDEAIRVTGGKCLIPIRKANGESLGYYVPPSAAEQHLKAMLPHLSPEHLEATRAAVANPSDTFDIEAFWAELSREDRD